MANPSTDGPTSANGTEILRRSYAQGVGDGGASYLINGTAGYIYTILSIVVGNAVSTAEDFYVLLFADGVDSTATRIDLIPTMTLGGKETFVFNDRLVLAGADEIKFYGNTSGCDFDVWCSYIEQRWV